VDFLNLQERQPVPDTSEPITDPLATEFFPVTHSLLSPEALARHIQVAYALGEVRACALLQHNLNDTYIVDTTTGCYFLRASQARRPNRWSWRTSEDILFELDVLLHLFRKGVPVAAPVTQRDGTYMSKVHAPEGDRHLVLFTSAQGEPLTPPRQTEPRARGYGGAVAVLHTASDDFASSHPRFALDLDFLLAKPLDILQPSLAHRLADWRYLRLLGAAVTERLAVLRARGLDSGLCHGDAHGGNAHMTPDGAINFFDFDVCGNGWRAYDIAVFFWGAALGRVRLGWDAQTVERLCAAYLSGYQERRPLGLADQEAIALLVILRQYWYLGVEAGNWDTWGIGDARREAFFDQELGFMREWAAEHHIHE
jgi:Ser/Thr protein kinase RdoA (MazF antagonist)